MIRLHSVATRTLRSRNFKSSPAFWSRSFCSSEAPGKSVTAGLLALLPNRILNLLRFCLTSLLSL